MAALDGTTITKLDEGGLDPSDPLHILRFTVPGDAAYPVGGYPTFTATLQAHTGRGSHPLYVQGRGVVGAGPTAYYLEYDNANDKLMVIVAATGIEAADGTNLSTATFRGTVFSK